MKTALNREQLAVEVVLRISLQPVDQRLRAKDLAERMGLSARYLEAVLQQLVAAGILASNRGPKGGYILAREKRRITLKDIAGAVADQSNHAEIKGSLQKKVLQPLWSRIESVRAEALAAITLQEIFDQAKKAGDLDLASISAGYTI